MSDPAGLGDPQPGSDSAAAAAPSVPAPVPDSVEPAAQDYHESSLWRWRGMSSLVGGAMFALLGLLLVAGTLAFRSDDVLENARPADLVRILASLESENDRLAQEQRRLETELSDQRSGSQEEALQAAQSRLEGLQVLAGTTPVHGPGIRVVIRDPDQGIDAADVLDAVQELRDAGAESIEISNVRVVVNTWFADPSDLSTPGIVISGTGLRPPYTVLAIGDPQTLGTALEIPGGVVDTVESAGGKVEIDRRDDLRIDATVPLQAPEYAKPGSS